MIHINDTYRLSSDKWNVAILQEKKMRKSKTTGETYEDWKDIKFYTSYPATLESLMLLGISDKELQSVKQIISKIDEFKALVSEIFKDIKIIKQGESEDK